MKEMIVVIKVWTSSSGLTRILYGNVWRQLFVDSKKLFGDYFHSVKLRRLHGGILNSQDQSG